MRFIKSSVLSLLATALLWGASQAADSSTAKICNPFYAMDTAFQRPGLSPDQQLDLVRELGFAGIAWQEKSPEEALAVAQHCEKRGLKMFAIYCPAKITTAGEITWSPTLPQLIAASQGPRNDHLAAHRRSWPGI